VGSRVDCRLAVVEADAVRLVPVDEIVERDAALLAEFPRLGTV